MEGKNKADESDIFQVISCQLFHQRCPLINAAPSLPNLINHRAFIEVIKKVEIRIFISCFVTLNSKRTLMKIRT